MVFLLNVLKMSNFFLANKKYKVYIFLRFIRTLNVLFKDVYKKKYLIYFT